MMHFINLPVVSFTPKGDQDVDHGAVYARLDHSFLYNGWYYPPNRFSEMVDVNNGHSLSLKLRIHGAPALVRQASIGVLYHRFH